MKRGNASQADPVEGRESRKTEPMEGKMNGTPNSDNVSTKLQRVAELARQMPEAALKTLAHHIDTEFLEEAFRRTRKDGAAGVDGQTAMEYAAQLAGNLATLLDRFKAGEYRAPPVRRVHIPKGDGSKTRPIGIPTFEDKVLQRAVTMVLEAVYEQDFLECSYGFRPGRSAHQALQALWRGLMRMGGGWVLEIDIKSFFDTVDHGHLRNFLDQRVRDGVIRRMIDKWLKAGVMEDGSVSYPNEGTPQGGVLSPLLANVYLHEVLDKWFARDVLPRMRGQAFLIRYADDAVLVFEREDDARRVYEVLPKRFGKYGLTLHPEKTRLIEFRPGNSGGGGFDLLGFRHLWAKSRKGRWVVKRKTAPSRFTRALRTLNEWCRTHRHFPVKEQHRSLWRKLQGHYAYYGITGNGLTLNALKHETERAWHKWLARRSNRGMPWVRFAQVLKRYPLPPARIVHSVYRLAASP
jgi:RNA-directed DNA polymerase